MSDEICPPMAVVPCEAVRKVNDSDSAYGNHWGTASWSLKASSAEGALKTAWEQDQATHAANTAAIEHNQRLRDRLKQIMQAAGIKDEYRVRDDKSRSRFTKYKTVSAGYLSDLRQFITLTDGFEYAQSRHKILSERFAGWRQKADQENAAKDAAREAEKARRIADIELASIIIRYGLPADIDDWTILRTLRGKDKYLDLAIAMENVRGDWNDGCGEVSDALERFAIEGGDDPKIAADVASAVVRFSDDRDGRVFRDTTWNYGRIYGLVKDEQLVTDAAIMRRRNV